KTFRGTPDVEGAGRCRGSWRDSNPRAPHWQCDALPLRHSRDALRSSTLLTGVTPAMASGLGRSPSRLPGEFRAPWGPAHTDRRLSCSRGRVVLPIVAVR